MKLTVFAIFLGCTMSLLAQQSGNEANKTLRATIQKWIAVMKETQNKQKEWKEQKQIFLDSRDSLSAETKQLEAEILAAFDRLELADEESKDKLAQKDRYDAGREALREGLDALEPKVSAVIPLLPKELASKGKLEKAIVDHQKNASFKNKNHLGLNARLTAMLTILIEAEKFNQVVTPFTGRTAESKGQKVLLDGAYFGLATGFAANESGTIAFHLKPGPDGWVEEELSGEKLIKEVRQLIDVANGSGETRLITVPLEIATKG